MIRLPAAFANTFMGCFRKDKLIGFPEIAVAVAPFVLFWDLVPKRLAASFTTITNHICHNLARSTAYDSPDPAFIPALKNKRPHFIGFQYVFRLCGQQGLTQFRVLSVFFLANQSTCYG